MASRTGGGVAEIQPEAMSPIKSKILHLLGGDTAVQGDPGIREFGVTGNTSLQTPAGIPTETGEINDLVVRYTLLILSCTKYKIIAVFIKFSFRCLGRNNRK